MSEHFMFNSFNTLIGLGLTICAFIMQQKLITCVVPNHSETLF